MAAAEAAPAGEAAEAAAAAASATKQQSTRTCCLCSLYAVEVLRRLRLSVACSEAVSNGQHEGTQASSAAQQRNVHHRTTHAERFSCSSKETTGWWLDDQD
jgi:hypothetical protein